MNDDYLKVAKGCGAKYEAVFDKECRSHGGFCCACRRDMYTFEEYELEAYTSRILASQQAAHDAEIAERDNLCNSLGSRNEQLHKELSTLEAALQEKLEKIEALNNKNVDELLEYRRQSKEYKQRAEAAEAECLEQARLNGMGSEREARLIAENAELRKLLESKVPEVTNEMIAAYLKANTEYWEETDKLNTSFVRTGTVKDATRVSLQAAMLAAAPQSKEPKQ